MTAWSSIPPWQRAAAPRSLPVDGRREQARAPRHSRFHVTLSFAKQKSLEKWGSPWFLISSWFGHWPQPRSVLPQSGPGSRKMTIIIFELMSGRNVASKLKFYLQKCISINFFSWNYYFHQFSKSNEILFFSISRHFTQKYSLFFGSISTKKIILHDNFTTTHCRTSATTRTGSTTLDLNGSIRHSDQLGSCNTSVGCFDLHSSSTISGQTVRNTTGHKVVK